MTSVRSVSFLSVLGMVLVVACGGSDATEPGCIEADGTATRALALRTCQTDADCRVSCDCNDGSNTTFVDTCSAGVCSGDRDCTRTCEYSGGVADPGTSSSSSSSGASPCTGASGSTSASSGAGSSSSSSGVGGSSGGGSSSSSGSAGGVRCTQSDPRECYCSPNANGVDLPSEVDACTASSVGGTAYCCATSDYPAGGTCSCAALYCRVIEGGCDCVHGATALDGYDQPSCGPTAGTVCCAGSNAASSDCQCGAISCGAGQRQVDRCEAGAALCGGSHPVAATSCR